MKLRLRVLLVWKLALSKEDFVITASHGQTSASHPGRAGGLPVIITIRIELLTTAEGDQVRITTGDTGKGIAPERLATIFDVGFSEKGSHMRMHAGLSNVYNVIQRHQRPDTSTERARRRHLLRNHSARTPQNQPCPGVKFAELRIIINLSEQPFFQDRLSRESFFAGLQIAISKISRFSIPCLHC